MGQASGIPSRRHLSPRHEAHRALDVIALLLALERLRIGAAYPTYLPGIFTPCCPCGAPYAAFPAEVLPRPGGGWLRFDDPGAGIPPGEGEALPSDKRLSDYPLRYPPFQKTRGHFSRRVIAYLGVNT